MARKYTEFGLEVRTKLLKQGKTVSWLAKRVGCSISFLSDIFAGARPLVSSRTDWKAKIEGVLEDDEDRGAEAFKEN